MAKPQRAKGRQRRRVRKNIAIGQAHIKTSFNNTLVTLTDKDGNVIAWESAGSVGFKGSRKSTPYAAQVTAESCARKGMEHGLQKVEVFVRGPGSGRETAVRSLQAAGLEVLGVKDVTPIPHNGCRPPGWLSRRGFFGVGLFRGILQPGPRSRSSGSVRRLPRGRAIRPGPFRLRGRRRLLRPPRGPRPTSSFLNLSLIHISEPTRPY